ncbi:ATP-binding protein [Streptacidiphilus sp. P02-A3a]|uniref:ATP-binding protein n=1 Tax=Streptacidiphilus sp. P02-A3a TaxID=2704468 RepID=UPI0015FA4917|nr:ATP-binding protein [Streptacidiphilus sp. P02-A3a]QMU71725.1 hypothetical protein GXP74_29250 [Streptacidiphilus sp. P02-A3a]
MLVADGMASANDLVGLVTAVCGALGAALGLPPLLASRRERRAQQAVEPPGPRLVLPSRVQLVDRVEEVGQVLRHLAAGEYVVTLEGGIGVGKSALAMEVAHRIAAGEGVGGGRSNAPVAFETLVWMDAANHCPDLVDLSRTLSLMTGERSLSAAPTAAKPDAIRSFLASHPCVLILDNLRVPADTTAQLPAFLRTLPSGSIALVSANTAGAVDGPRVEVPELPSSDAQELLAREAARRGVTALVQADGPLVARIHRLVGGNPRAIGLFVLACSRFAGPLSRLLDELETGQGQMTAALYDAVWSEVSAERRSVLIACAYLDGGADVGQVAAALAKPEDEVQPALAALWADGLLTSAPTLDRAAYTCSAPLRVFVRGRADASSLATVRTQLATYLAGRFGADWEDAAGAAAHVDAIRTLIRELDAAGDYRLCLDLFIAVYDILFTLGLFDDRIDLGWVAFHAADELWLPDEQSLALSVVSSTHAIRGEDSQAAQAVQLGLAIARQAGSAREIARQLRCEAFRLFRAGRAAEALAVVEAEDAEGMARGAGDPNNMIDILSLVGAARWHLGDLDGCEATVLRFLDECEQMPWERGKAYALRDLAEVRLLRRDFDAAADLAERARRIAEEYRDTRQLARIGLTQARLYLFGGRMRQAQDTARIAASQSHALLLTGEQAEAEAVGRLALRCLRMPWLRPFVTGRPRIRFTAMTVGGD